MGKKVSVLPHPWLNVVLTPQQEKAFHRLDTLLARGEGKLPLCLVGEIASGKTTLARYWLATHTSTPERHLLSVNRLLLDALKAEGSLDDFAENPSKVRIFGRIALEEALDRYFAEMNVLVLDGLELAVAFRVPVLELAAVHTQKKRIVLACVPWNRQELPPLRETECHLIWLTNPETETTLSLFNG